VYVGLATLGGAGGARHVLTEEVDQISSKKEERSDRAYGGSQEVARAIRPAPKRERRADGTRLLAQGAVQAAGHVPLLLQELQAFLGSPSQAQGAIQLE